MSRLCCSASASPTWSCSHRWGTRRRSGKFLAKNGPGMHHAAYRCDDVASAIEQCRTRGLRMIDEQSAAGYPRQPGRVRASGLHGRSADRAGAAGGRSSLMARDSGEVRRVEVGFSGGQVILMRLPEKSYEELRRAVQDGRSWYEVESADGIVAVDLSQVVFVKLESYEHRVGFSGLLLDAPAALRWPAWPSLGAALWWRKNPSACPYSQRFCIELPHPGITRRRLIEILAAARRRTRPRDRTGHRLLHVRDGRSAGRRPGRRLRHPAGDARSRGAGGEQAWRHQRRSYAGRRTVTSLLRRQLRRRVADHGARRDSGPGAGAEGGRTRPETGRSPDRGGDVLRSARGHARELRERGERAGLSFARRIGGPLAFFARLEKAPIAQPRA